MSTQITAAPGTTLYLSGGAVRPGDVVSVDAATAAGLLASGQAVAPSSSSGTTTGVGGSSTGTSTGGTSSSGTQAGGAIDYGPLTAAQLPANAPVGSRAFVLDAKLAGVTTGAPAWKFASGWGYDGTAGAIVT